LPSIRVTHFFYFLAPLSPSLFSATTRDCRAPLRLFEQMTGVMHLVHPSVSLPMAASLMPPNIYPFEDAEMRDIAEFQSNVYAVDC
jgi:hypothetical protein